MNKPRIRLPDSIKVGDIIEVKTLISHGMETGQRKDANAKIVPRDIIHSFTAMFNGRPVFQADLQPGISANPFISFQMRVGGPGEFEFSWVDDQGAKTVERTRLNVV